MLVSQIPARGWESRRRSSTWPHKDVRHWIYPNLFAINALPDPTLFIGAVGVTEWDPALAEALEPHRLKVEEEAVVEMLLADLAG